MIAPQLLRQTYSLSPFLLIIMMEALERTLKKKEKGEVKRPQRNFIHPLGHTLPIYCYHPLGHTLPIYWCNIHNGDITVREVNALKQIFAEFEKDFDREISLNQSKIFFMNPISMLQRNIERFLDSKELEIMEISCDLVRGWFQPSKPNIIIYIVLIDLIKCSVWLCFDGL